nr:hypothetical protein BSM_14950 [uncultured archaeon]CBH38505.1 hypothetical protein BSM_19820 [uncultured archaeon]
MVIEDVEGLETPEGIIKPLLFKNLSDEPARLLCVSAPPVVKSAEEYKQLLRKFQKER